MRQKRVFIAISLPEKEKQKLVDYQNSRLLVDCFRHTKISDLHLTLVFIGEIFDDQLASVISLLKEICHHIEPINIDLEKIKYGPNNQSPRLVWIEGQANVLLEKLKREIEQKLMEKEVAFQMEDRKFRPHITLTRLNKFYQDELPLAKDIETDFKISFMACDIKLMESELLKSGAEYTVLEEFQFKS